MAAALRLAAKGAGRCAPNPMVGAVVVRAGDVISRGWHRRAGGDHAEVVALRRACDRARGATLYVTLEPCCHTGRTGPCTGAIADAGIARVVAPLADPFEKVAGGGFRILRRHGIRVDVGEGRAEARRLNEAYFRRIATGRPWVDLKMASTLDGRIADRRGESKWITGEEARRDVQRLRARSDALLVGAGTVIADDPKLTVRPGAVGREPFRIVLDGALRVSPRAALFTGNVDPRRTVVVCTADPDARRARAIEKTGAVLIPVRRWRGGRAPLRTVLRTIAAIGVNRLLVEGGGDTAGSFVAAGLVDRFHLFVAPKALGEGVGILRGLPGRSLRGAKRFRLAGVTRRGGDVRIVYERIEEGSCSPD